MRKLELLAPAKNLECGIAAISHGADAVYIGASSFGARAAAANSIADIEKLCLFAHTFQAKVYVTVNTIIFDSELDNTLQLIEDLDRIGVDAILVQDMGVMQMISKHTPSLRMQMHASTQTDNRTAEKVKWLQALGFSRVVLARELSLEEIKSIHKAAPDVELEVFVHGALCVSYSGICYASQHCFHRSANRGECAQFCRMEFDLVDSDGRMIEHNRHLLSMKDLCQIEHLEEIADAGACSFKIEGRLKDVSYVKNVVSAYSQKLNDIIKKHPDRYCRSSLGHVHYNFTPNLRKTFNRGFTNYFLGGRKPGIASFDTPKAMGEYVGKVKELRNNSFNVAGTASFANGDGLCFINDDHQLEGFRINRAEGSRLFPHQMPQHLRPGMALYRNNDVAFEKILAGNTAERKIPIDFNLDTTPEGFRLSMNIIGADTKAESIIAFEHQSARTNQKDNIIKQLSKLGDTPYEAVAINIAKNIESLFIPSSLLAKARRELTQRSYPATPIAPSSSPSLSSSSPASPSLPSGSRGLSSHTAPSLPSQSPSPSVCLNISNRIARAFYESRGLQHPADAFEIKDPGKGAMLMQCRHCLRFALGHCVKHGGQKPTWREPLFLVLGDGRRFQLQFDCAHCQMNVLET